MIELIHCLYSVHDEKGRAFAASVPEGVPKYCFYTQLDEPAVQQHYDENGIYPYVGQLPGVLVKVPPFSSPSYTVQMQEPDGPVETITVPERNMPEQYLMLEPCKSYEHALEAIAVYEDNIGKAIRGEIRYDPYPYDFLYSE